MYGLRRIIQIDGFIAGIKTVVEVDDHSIVNGTNGAGKSSTLKLLSFFYGSDPSQLASHSTGRDSFSDFYLPRQSSLIVFEYARESGLCCAVAYRNKSGTKHVYRFLEGGYSEERFSQSVSNGQSTYCKGYDLKTHWRELGLACSQQIEVVTDYRAIIQNDSVLLNRLSESKALRRLALRYCLGDRNTHMRYIERICSAILSRSGNMDRMKDMLADIMSEDGVNFPLSPIHKNDVLIAKEVSSLREFEKNIPHLKTVLAKHYERLDTETLIKGYAGQILTAQTQLSDDTVVNNARIEALIIRVSEINTQWDVQYDALSKRRIDAGNEVTYYKDKVTGLDKIYQQYEDEGIRQRIHDVNNISDFFARKEQAESRYGQLSENIKQEESLFNRNVSQAMQHYDEQRIITQDKLDAIKNDLAAQERRFNDDINRVVSDQYAEKEKTNQGAVPEHDEIIRAMANAQAQASNGGKNEQEAFEIKKAEDHVDHCSITLTKSEQALSDKTGELEEIKSTRESQDKKLTRTKRHYREQTDKQAELHKLAYAQDGTWLKKLRESDPRWVSGIGKIIDPNLLQRTDIEAHLTDNDSQSVMGWSINLEAIATPVHAEHEEQLRHDYSVQSEAVAREKEAVAQQEINLAKANKAYGELYQEHESAKRLCKAHRKEKEEALTHYRELNQLIDEAIVDRKLAAKGRAKKQESLLAAFKETVAGQLKNIEEQFKDKKDDINLTWLNQEKTLQGSINATTSRLNDNKKHHDKRLIEIKSDYLAACDNKGIDTKTLSQAKTTMDSSYKKVTFINEDMAKVDLYQQWIDGQWSKREDHVIAALRHQKNHDKIGVEIDEAQRTKTRLKDDLIEEKRADERVLKGMNEKQECINALKGRLNPYLKMSEPGALEMPLDLLLQKTQSALEDYEALKIEVVDDIHEINNKISRYSETQIGIAWQRARDSLREKLGYDDAYNHNFLLNLPQALDVFIEEEVKSIKSARIESLRATGKGLADFFEKLLVVHKRIKSQSRKITDAISENMLIKALSSMEIELNSKVQTLDYWDALQRFSLLWNEWRESGEDNLPEQEFIDEMSILIDVLQNIESGHHLRHYFDLSIRMIENGNERIIRNDNQLDNATSDGLKYLALCVIFIGISRLLCPDKNVKLHWPIDELGILHGENIRLLFEMLNKGGITMVGGFPSEDPSMLRHFKHRQVIDIKQGVRVINLSESKLKTRIDARSAAGQ